jgi:hypothetical protein
MRNMDPGPSFKKGIPSYDKKLDEPLSIVPSSHYDFFMKLTYLLLAIKKSQIIQNHR